ncbi:g3283 [Coccomyxa elongata]
MRGFGAASFRNFGPLGPRRPTQCQPRKASSSSSSSTVQPGVGNAVLKAALTTGALSLAGDLLAQSFTQRHGKKLPGQSAGLDAVRAARMGGFGFAFYGPYQYYWYKYLDKLFPTKSVPHFASKVFLNQAALGPVVLSAVLLWNYAFTKQLDRLPEKVKRDFVPTLINGWKFWVPASMVNFYLVPLQYRVLYMSTCGMFWTGYLSYTSN